VDLRLTFSMARDLRKSRRGLTRVALKEVLSMNSRRGEEIPLSLKESRGSRAEFPSTTHYLEELKRRCLAASLDSIYWLTGVERARNVARFIDVNLNSNA